MASKYTWTQMSASGSTEADENALTLSDEQKKLKEVFDLEEKITQEFERLDRLILFGAAAGPRLPLLREAKEELDEEIPKIKQRAHQAGLIQLERSELDTEASSSLASASTESTAVNPADLIPTLDAFVAKYTPLLPEPEPAENQLSLAKERTEEEEAEIEERVKRIEKSFEEALGHKPYPGQMSFGMVPRQYRLGGGGSQG